MGPRYPAPTLDGQANAAVDVDGGGRPHWQSLRGPEVSETIPDKDKGPDGESGRVRAVMEWRFSHTRQDVRRSRYSWSATCGRGDRGNMERGGLGIAQCGGSESWKPGPGGLEACAIAPAGRTGTSDTAAMESAGTKGGTPRTYRVRTLRPLKKIEPDGLGVV